MRHYAIYIPFLTFGPPPFFAVVYDQSRCYIVPGAPGGWNERSLGNVDEVPKFHLVAESAQERIAAMLMLPEHDEPIEYV
jgi:hypothetical protein